MGVRIRNLVCRVTVRKGRKTDTLHRGGQPQQPSMAFVHPAPESRAETAPEPSQTATEPSEEGTDRQRKAAPGAADVRAVTDRVYDLMKEELSLGRLRNKPW